MITIVIPAYNEEAVIERCVLKIIKEVRTPDYEILVVDDGSKDKTPDILKRLSKKHKHLRYISHRKNKGLGGAIRTGIKEAKGEIVITMDADLTHPPKMIDDLVKHIRKGYDIVLASRYVKGGGMKDVPLWRVMISVFANNFFSLVYWTRVKDITSGFKAYRAPLIKSIRTKERSFEIQLEIMVRLLRKRPRIKEIPIVLVNREFGKSKFNFMRIIPNYARNIIKFMFIRWL